MQSYEFYIKPSPGEYVDATVPLSSSSGAIISGLVTDRQTPVEGALVLLLEQDSGQLLFYTVTDTQGRFWFGPLPDDTLYLLRVQKLSNQTRTVELT